MFWSLLLFQTSFLSWKRPISQSLSKLCETTCQWIFFLDFVWIFWGLLEGSWSSSGHPINVFSLINFADFSACSLALTSFSVCYLLSSLACPWLPCFLPAACCLRPLGLPPAKLMNGYMVLTNGGSQPRSSPSLSSRTLSRPAGDIIVNMDTDPSVRKMDTIVKLDAVSFSLTLCSFFL